jgi:protease-4
MYEVKFMRVFIETFSKILAFLSAILIFFLIVSLISNFIADRNMSHFSYYKGNKLSEQKIALLNIGGPIISEPQNISNFQIFNSLKVIYPSLIRSYLKELSKKNIVGLIISIDSPGGSVSATQKIYKIIKEFKKDYNIPIYFHSSNILASGAYWISLSGDKIYADYGAIIGSIGVKGPDWIYYNSPTSLSPGLLGGYVESPNGIKLYSNTAGISKDIFNPFRQPSEKEVIQLQQMVDSIYEDFINLVSSSRKIEAKIIKDEIGSMIFSTNQAKNYYLIDNQMDIENVMKILSKRLNLSDEQFIINKKNKNYNFLDLSFLSRTDKLNTHDLYQSYIEKKFCNNLIYELSVVSIASQKSGC